MENNPAIIECIGRKESKDRNGKPYVALFFRNWKFFPVFNPQTGETVYIREHSVVGYINQYPESYTSSKRPDPNYMTQIGDLITGQVVTKYVVPYLTEKGYRVNYYNAVVFGNSTSEEWEDSVKRAFDKAGVTIASNDEVDPNFIIAKEEPEEGEIKSEDFNLNDPEQRKSYLDKLVSKGAILMKPNTDFDEPEINF